MFLSSAGLHDSDILQITSNRTFVLMSASMLPVKNKLDMYHNLKIRWRHSCFSEEKKLTMLIFGTGLPIIKHLIKSLNVYGVQNMHIRIKHIRHNQNCNYSSLFALSHLSCSAKKPWFKTFYPSVRKKKQTILYLPKSLQSLEFFGYWYSSCWVTDYRLLLPERN